jgi:arylsulfatase A-like enzyme
MIKLIDDQLGRVLARLDALGLRDDTIVIFTSDHGETLGDHGLIQKGCRFYEGLVRVPLIFRWPGHIEAGQLSDALVELTDKAPTLLELAGLPVPGYTLGRSLMAILAGRTREHRDGVRCEYIDALDLPDASRATMWRNRRYKLVVYHGHDLGELFDLDQDPWEHRNLWDDPTHQNIKAELMQQSFDAAIAAIDPGSSRIGPY